MIRCKKCGARLQDDATFCSKCGANVLGAYGRKQADPEATPDFGTPKQDENGFSPSTSKPETVWDQPSQPPSPPFQGSNSFLWGLIGFVFPWVGLILYIIWKPERPGDATAAGRGALFSVIGIFVLVIGWICLVSGFMIFGN